MEAESHSPRNEQTNTPNEYAQLTREDEAGIYVQDKTEAQAMAEAGDKDRADVAFWNHAAKLDREYLEKALKAQIGDESDMDESALWTEYSQKYAELREQYPEYNRRRAEGYLHDGRVDGFGRLTPPALPRLETFWDFKELIGSPTDERQKEYREYVENEYAEAIAKRVERDLQYAEKAKTRAERREDWAQAIHANPETAMVDGKQLTPEMCVDNEEYVADQEAVVAEINNLIGGLQVGPCDEAQYQPYIQDFRERGWWEQEDDAALRKQLKPLHADGGTKLAQIRDTYISTLRGMTERYQKDADERKAILDRIRGEVAA